MLLLQQPPQIQYNTTSQQLLMQPPLRQHLLMLVETNLAHSQPLLLPRPLTQHRLILNLRHLIQMHLRQQHTLEFVEFLPLNPQVQQQQRLTQLHLMLIPKLMR